FAGTRYRTGSSSRLRNNGKADAFEKTGIFDYFKNPHRLLSKNKGEIGSLNDKKFNKNVNDYCNNGPKPFFYNQRYEEEPEEKISQKISSPFLNENYVEFYSISNRQQGFFDETKNLKDDYNYFQLSNSSSFKNLDDYLSGRLRRIPSYAESNSLVTKSEGTSNNKYREERGIFGTSQQRPLGFTGKSANQPNCQYALSTIRKLSCKEKPNKSTSEPTCSKTRKIIGENFKYQFGKLHDDNDHREEEYFIEMILDKFERMLKGDENLSKYDNEEPIVEKILDKLLDYVEGADSVKVNAVGFHGRVNRKILRKLVLDFLEKEKLKKTLNRR
ncbi:hypothetical protein MHBO_001259, partial [Bonamia ostreae]